jgi:hypothetical protein
LFDLLIGLMVMASVPAYFVLQPATVIRWRGKWRVAALAPLLVTVPALVFSLYALALDSNLWPLTLIFASAAGTLYLVAIWLVQGWRWT